MDELTKEFLEESLEGLDRMDGCLTDLEGHPDDAKLLDEIFRAVHTIKGTTGFLGFARLEKLAHAGESLLGSLREGAVTATREVVDGLLLLMDGLRAILRLIETTGSEGSRAGDEDSGLIVLMGRLNQAPGTVVENRFTTLPGPRDPVTPATSGPNAAVSAASEKTLRIDVDVLNRMMNLVGELVLTRNQILQSGAEAANFPELARRLDTVTADLRETVMQARMQPVGHVFGKFPRMVRDLAVSCGKHVRIEFSGESTGLDKSLLEAIKDPLTHAVRNAVDHGIEDPAGRAFAGKPVEGCVSLRAHHHGGWVVIEVADDGGGIATARVLAKAIERALITPERAQTMSDREALQLIFLPGFSTAAEVTHISGRGVGMDVVRANVEKIGGTVEVESTAGRGTLLRLRVPLTLAIVRALVVRSAGQSFCMPQGMLAELVYVPRREAGAAVERIGGVELYRLRERLLPLVRLDSMLAEGPTAEEAATEGFYLLVLQSDGSEYGLVVDDVLAPEEIVVKPLSPVLREIGLFSGATVLGNGSLGLILDVASIAARAGVKSLPEEAGNAAPSSGLPTSKLPFLVFEERVAGERPQRKAVPLSDVERIETVRAGEIEFIGGQPLLQYRGELLALEDAGSLLAALRDEDTVTVLIFDGGYGAQSGVKPCPGRRHGIVVDRVLEVADGELLSRSEPQGDRLALVSERLAVVQRAGGSCETLREVA